MGESEEKISRNALKRFGRLPEEIKNAPELNPGLDLFWDAFADLASCRSPGFGTLSQIPWTAINDYAIRFGIEGFLFDRLIYYISEMDNFFLKKLREKVDSK